jgi:diguanylate cyclase (GGDEF)-like protein
MLNDRLALALAQARRSGRRVALMFIDIDRFKSINDSLGHAAGDRLLKEVAQRLVATVRSADTVARLGGDEFVVLLADIGEPGDAATVADKLLQSLQASMLLDGHAIHFTASIGVAVHPEDGGDLDALMRNADIAMYRAKAAGRNTTRFFTAEMNKAVIRLFHFESSLRTALEQDQFELHYQPQVDVVAQRVVGLEALLRWNSSDGPIRPDEFIPVAEETGQILEIGDWVLRQACAQAVQWQAEGRPPVVMAVNLSPRQFRQPGLVDDVRHILADCGLAPQWLELEITESTLMAQTGETMAKLHALSDMGVRLAIDDFGTGYSSLNYLKRFPVNKLKIDQSFVRDIFVDRDDAAIVDAIIRLAQALGLTTLAEGVETAEQLAALVKAGCTHCQGYFFSRPLPAAEADRLFAATGDAQLLSAL